MGKFCLRVNLSEIQNAQIFRKKGFLPREGPLICALFKIRTMFEFNLPIWYGSDLPWKAGTMWPLNLVFIHTFNRQTMSIHCIRKFTKLFGSLRHCFLNTLSSVTWSGHVKYKRNSLAYEITVKRGQAKYLTWPLPVTLLRVKFSIFCAFLGKNRGRPNSCQGPKGFMRGKTKNYVFIRVHGVLITFDLLSLSTLKVGHDLLYLGQCTKWPRYRKLVKGH